MEHGIYNAHFDLIWPMIHHCPFATHAILVVKSTHTEMLLKTERIHHPCLYMNNLLLHS
jgi:hypothetical protein